MITIPSEEVYDLLKMFDNTSNLSNDAIAELADYIDGTQTISSIRNLIDSCVEFDDIDECLENYGCKDLDEVLDKDYVIFVATCDNGHVLVIEEC